MNISQTPVKRATVSINDISNGAAILRYEDGSLLLSVEGYEALWNVKEADQIIRALAATLMEEDKS